MFFSPEFDHNFSHVEFLLTCCCTRGPRDFGATVFAMIVFNLHLFVLNLCMCNSKGYIFESLTSRMSFSIIIIIFLSVNSAFVVRELDHAKIS